MSRSAAAHPVEWHSPDGRLCATVRYPADASGAVLVCIHGGGCTARYFDLRGYSFADQAVERGYTVAMVNRPGYGGSPPPNTDRPIAEAAELIARMLPVLAADLSSEGCPVGLVGHSIGGAVAIACAAHIGARVSVLAVSGAGVVRSAAAHAAFADVDAGVLPDPPPGLFFGPEGTFDWRGPIALRAAAAPWRGDEVRELMHEWPNRFPAVAGAVRQSVLLQIAEHDHVWDMSQASLARLGAAFTAARQVDMAILPDGGHLYEIHKGGSAASAARLDFFDRWLIER